MSLRSLWNGALARRHGGVVLFLALFLAVATAMRVVLLVKAADAVTFDAALVAAFAWGVLFDLGAAVICAAPLALILAAVPARLLAGRAGSWTATAGCAALCYALFFNSVAEWLFWDEFSARFNFIAVDYLVYTKEVLGNIQESYPMPWIIGGTLAAALAAGFALARWAPMRRWLTGPAEPAGRRFRAVAAWTAAASLTGVALDSEHLPNFADNYHRELAKNGVWSLFAAFRNNQLDYEQFYPTLPVDEAFRRVRAELAVDGSEALGADPRDTLRFVRAPGPGPELRPNVIQITVESLSADFLGTFNRVSRLTPNLEDIARRSLLFERLYATGTRTDRGMEALTLALPPTPGRSLIKRPRNENLFTLGSVFRSRGYDTAFIYGGFGYFDNMNYFFGNNGYRVIDRTSPQADITFSNVWGACDEDLFRWTLREADAAHAAGRKFHHFVMTTSNHRPFTFPDGKIDLPSKISGRAGAVKYTDFAIGQFLREAEKKPWYRDTVFVIVADHCASVAGKAALPVQNYHIPLMIFSPGGHIPPGRVPHLMSQVDYAPTLLALLNWSYASRFYGRDVRVATDRPRVLLGNYQKLGLHRPGMLSILSPVKRVAEFDCEPGTFELRERAPEAASDTIAYYQTASHLYRHGTYREVTAAEQTRYAEDAARRRVTKNAGQ